MLACSGRPQKSLTRELVEANRDDLARVNEGCSPYKAGQNKKKQDPIHIIEAIDVRCPSALGLVKYHPSHALIT